MASNVIIAPSNATYHTDSGRTTVSNYSSNYTPATVDALSKYGFSGSGSSGSGESNLYYGSGVSNFLNDVVTKSSSSLGDAMREAMQIANGNSAMSQAFAREQMDFQRSSDQYAMNWSAQEAQKTRDWQEQMSNTAHQREVDDLIKAGLNPVLSANGGASTPSGATGQAYTSSGAMGQVDYSATALMGNIINSATQLQINERNLEAQMLMAANQLESNERISHVNADASVLGHQINAGAILGSAQYGFEGSKYATDTNASNIEKQLANAMAISQNPSQFIKDFNYLTGGNSKGLVFKNPIREASRKITEGIYNFFKNGKAPSNPS